MKTSGIRILNKHLKGKRLTKDGKKYIIKLVRVVRDWEWVGLGILTECGEYFDDVDIDEALTINENSQEKD